MNDFPLDLELVRYIPIEIAQKNQVVPLKIKGNLLMVAIVILWITILDSIEKLNNMEVEPVICSEAEINQLINSMYGMQSDLGDIIGTMEVDSKVEEESDNKDEVQVASLQDMAGEALVFV